jgi:hypothetical protein
MYESLREDIERLHAEIAITERKLGSAGDETCTQHDSLLCGLLATNQVLQKKKEEHLEVALQSSERALKRVELAAQQLVAQAHSDAPTRAPRQNSRSGL